jgi:hypothetical protein
LGAGGNPEFQSKIILSRLKYNLERDLGMLTTKLFLQFF